MENDVSIIKCVRCKTLKPRETASKHSIYTNSQNVPTQRYMCRECEKSRKRIQRGAKPVPTVVSTTSEDTDDIELVSEDYVTPEGW